MKRWVLIPIFFNLLGTAAWHVQAQDATADLRQEVAGAPNSAPAMVTRTLKDAGANAPLVAARAAVVAIQALGPDASRKQVAAIVYAAIRVAPASALRVVRAAVNAAPNAAPEIAAAAVRAVPNPWKEVRYQKQAPAETLAQNTVPTLSNLEPDFKSVASREPDFKSPADHAFDDALAVVLDPAAPGDPMSLAEAIVQTAFDARPGMDLGALQIAVDTALFGDPAALFNAVGGSRGISGVGDVGNSNYANEPHLSSPTPTPTPGGKRRTGQGGPGNPNIPVVSP